jgi:hypothetical protein
MTGREGEAEIVAQENLRPQRARQHYRQADEPDIDMAIANELRQLLHRERGRLISAYSHYLRGRIIGFHILTNWSGCGIMNKFSNNEK